MKSKVYKGESMKEGEKILKDSIKLIEIEVVKTEDGVGCSMSTINGFSQLVKLAGKDDDWLINQMQSILETLSAELTMLVQEVETNVFENALDALKKEINLKECN